MDLYRDLQTAAVNEVQDFFRVDLSRRTLTLEQGIALNFKPLNASEIDVFQKRIGITLTDSIRSRLSQAWAYFYFGILIDKPPPRDEVIAQLKRVCSLANDPNHWDEVSRERPIEGEELTEETVAFRFFATLVQKNISNIAWVQASCEDLIATLKNRRVTFALKRNPSLRWLFREIHLIADDIGLSAALPSDQDKEEAVRSTARFQFGKTFYDLSLVWARSRLKSVARTRDTIGIIDHAAKSLDRYQGKDYGPILDLLRDAKTDQITPPGRLWVDAARVGVELNALSP